VEGRRPSSSSSDEPQADAGILSLRSELKRFAESLPKEELPSALVHPGITDWAERPELLVVCQDLGLNAVSPPARVLTWFSNKLNLLGEADRLGIPTLVASFEPLQSLREIELFMKKNKQLLPFILKSVRGESSERMQVIQEREDVRRKIPLWLEQLRQNTGDPIIFAERYLEGARHIVVPFVRFQDSAFQIFPMIDASLQCRFRKMVEFCPATHLDPEIARQLEAWSKTLASATGFVGVGSLEFMVDGSRAFLVEGAARLNMGFHLWEKVSGAKVVEWQLAALEGRPPSELHSKDPSSFALSARIYAEDSLLHLPQPGFVAETSKERSWGFAEGSGELNLLVSEGDVIAPDADGLLGLVWVSAKAAENPRRKALGYAKRILEETWIAGSLQTNERFLLELFDHSWVKEGMFHAGFVEEEFLPEIRPSAPVMKSMVSICKWLSDQKSRPTVESRWYLGEQRVASTDLLPPDWVGSPSVRPSLVPDFSWVSGRVRSEKGGELRVCAYPVFPDRWQVRLGPWVFSVKRLQIEAGETPKARISALVPGVVHSILFREGSVVPAHETLLIVRSLKILVPHALPVPVRILKWKIAAGSSVNAGQELAEFELIR
jgi:biotin carboxylase